MLPLSNYRWNLTCLALVEAGWGLAGSFLSFSAVLPMLASSFGASLAVVGLMPGLAAVANAVPQLLAAHRTAGMRRQLGFVARWHVYPTLVFLPLAALVHAGGSGPLRVALLYLALGLWWLGVGFCVPVWTSFVGRVAGEERRSNALGVMSTVGLGSGVVGAWLAGRLLAAYPGNEGYVLAVLAAFAFYNFGNLFWLGVREPEVEEVEASEEAPRPGLREYLAGLAAHVRGNAEFTRFLATQQLLSLYPALGSFYMLYARERFGAGPEVLLGWVGTSMTSQALGSVIYGMAGDRLGAGVALAGSQLLLVLAMSASLAARSASEMTAVAVLLGLFYGTYFNARTAMVMELARGGQSTAYLAVNSLVSTPAAVLVPAAAGWMIERYGFPWVISLALALTVAGTVGPVAVRAARMVRVGRVAVEA